MKTAEEKANKYVAEVTPPLHPDSDSELMQDFIQKQKKYAKVDFLAGYNEANVSGNTFTIDDMKKAFMAGADKKYWTKIHLTGVVSGLDYELEPVFEKWFENYR